MEFLPKRRVISQSQQRQINDQRGERINVRTVITFSEPIGVLVIRMPDLIWWIVPQRRNIDAVVVNQDKSVVLGY
jgi:hypothetical protein